MIQRNRVRRRPLALIGTFFLFSSTATQAFQAAHSIRWPKCYTHQQPGRMQQSNNESANLETIEDDKDEEEEDEETETVFYPTRTRNAGSSSEEFREELEKATLHMLDTEVYHLGSFNPEDVETIGGLMVAWSRQRTVTAAVTAERLLRRVVDDLTHGNRNIQLTTRMYIYVMDAWSRCGQAERCSSIHEALVNEFEETKNDLLAPSMQGYNTVINAWAKSNHEHAHLHSEKILNELITSYQSGGTTLKPNAATFASTMDAYSKSSDPNAVKRCWELFWQMDELGVPRNSYTYSALQNVIAKSDRPNAPKECLAILRSMLKEYHESDCQSCQPSSLHFNNVFNACSRRFGQASARLAHDLLQEMSEPDSDVAPDKMSYAMTILACSRGNQPKLALQNLCQMERVAKEQALQRQVVSSAAPSSVALDLECFNVVLMSLSRHEEYPPSALIGIVKRMQDYAKEDPTVNTTPTVRSWNAVLNSLARQQGATPFDDDATQKAHRILKFMQGQGQGQVVPNAYSYTAVLNSYKKSHDPRSVQAADDILQQMEADHSNGVLGFEPDVYHYTIVCSIWAKSRNPKGPQRVLQILGTMLASKNRRPNTRTYNAILDCLSRHAPLRAEELLLHLLDSRQDEVSLETFSFNSVIHGLCRSKLPDGGQRAEAVLDRFLEQAEMKSIKGAPDARSFTHIITHYARSRAIDAPYRAEYVLNRLVAACEDQFEEDPENVNIYPTREAFCSVMNAYAYRRHRDAGTNAERLLRVMYKLGKKYEVPDIEPNVDVYNAVLFCWANTENCDGDCASRADQHLQYMETESDPSKRPNALSYEHVLTAWSKSQSPDKVSGALDVLRRMQAEAATSKIMHVNERPFALVINACAFSNNGAEDMKTFEVAVSLLDEMTESKHACPASLSYGWFIQACGRLRIPRDLRMQQIERAFTACCEAGMVNDFVLTRLQGAAPESLQRKVLRGYANLKQMPMSWKKRVNRGPSRKQRRQRGGEVKIRQ